MWLAVLTEVDNERLLEELTENRVLSSEAAFELHMQFLQIERELIDEHVMKLLSRFDSDTRNFILGTIETRLVASSVEGLINYDLIGTLIP